jgi:hypothetical protein
VKWPVNKVREGEMESVGERESGIKHKAAMEVNGLFSGWMSRVHGLSRWGANRGVVMREQVGNVCKAKFGFEQDELCWDE